MSELLNDTSFWVLIAFCCFVALVWKKASAALAKGLDGRIETVRRQLNEAQKLREEAQILFDQYESQRLDSDKTAKEIIENANALAKSIREQAHEEAARIAARHKAMVEMHIKQAEIQAIAEVRAEATEISMKMVRELIQQNLDDGVRQSLFQQSVDGLSKQVN
jgi:F-type H+-transporting ATPase subunit b